MTIFDWDCAIIGAGPAGLTAATYLGRFTRRCVVIDAGQSRLKRIPLTRNAPGFPDGVGGEALHALLWKQAFRYGARHIAGHVGALRRHGAGFALEIDGALKTARTVIVATGAQLFEPDLDSIDEGLARGWIRYCPICDGFEARDKRIAVLGGRAGAVREACFLRTFAEDVSFAVNASAPLTTEDRACAEGAGVKIVRPAIVALALDDGVILRDGAGGQHHFDVVYPSLGCAPRSELAIAVGADVSAEGGIVVDAHQRTSVRGLYAAGDVLQGLDQIASAYGQAAIAAVAIHNDLAALDG